MTAYITSIRSRKQPRPLLEVCNDTFGRVLDAAAQSGNHPVERVVVAGDSRSKILLVAIVLPDRFAALQTAASVESNGAEYPILATLQPADEQEHGERRGGKGVTPHGRAPPPPQRSPRLAFQCPDPRAWTAFFTPDGRALRAEPKVKDEVAFRRAELLRCLAEFRLEERRVLRRGRRDAELLEQMSSSCAVAERAEVGAADARASIETADGDGDDGSGGDYANDSDNDVEIELLRAQKRKKRREKDRRQRARRKEKSARAQELEQLEREVMQDGVTVAELKRGFKLVMVGSEGYFDELVAAKKLGLKVVRLPVVT